MARSATTPLLSPATPVEGICSACCLNDPRVKRAVALMREKLHLPVTIAELAAEARLSPFHFLRVFKEVTGQTPHRYLTGLRIDEVKQLIKQGCTVAEAATRCGFSSPAHLSDAFLRETGSRPSVWRSSQAS